MVSVLKVPNAIKYTHAIERNCENGVPSFCAEISVSGQDQEWKSGVGQGSEQRA